VKVFWVIALLVGLTGGYQNFGETFAFIFSAEVWRVIFDVSEADPPEKDRSP
jgi:hypothetical protein